MLTVTVVVRTKDYQGRTEHGSRDDEMERTTVERTEQVEHSHSAATLLQVAAKPR